MLAEVVLIEPKQKILNPEKAKEESL